MKIAISTESTSDLSKDLLQQYDIHTTPLSVVLGNETKLDGEVSSDTIFDYVNRTKQLPKTSAVNTYQYEEHFRSLLKDYDAIIHVSLSSGISSTYQNAKNAANEFEGKVHVIDSLSLSSGVGLLAIYAAELVKQELEVNKIVEKVTDRVKTVQLKFVLQNVDYLYKGGRCSKLAFLGANIFHICPQIIMTGGKMDAGKKYRGNFYNVVEQYVDDLLKECTHPDLERIFIAHSPIDDKNILEMVKQKLASHGFKNIYDAPSGCTVLCHCGRNAIGVIYLNDK